MVSQMSNLFTNCFILMLKITAVILGIFQSMMGKMNLPTFFFFEENIVLKKWVYSCDKIVEIFSGI